MNNETGAGEHCDMDQNTLLKSNLNCKFQFCFGIIKNIFNLLKTHRETKNIFKNYNILKSKRQAPNLKKLLTNARFGKNDKPTGVEKCNDKRCRLCIEMIEGRYFQFDPHNTFEIRTKMNCNTLNCVYVLRCRGCMMTYIGETNNLRLRVNLHRDQINRKTGLNVCRHINECSGTNDPKFEVMPIYKVKEDDENLRKEKEKMFIIKYRPQLNSEMYI